MLIYGMWWLCARTATLKWSRVGRSTIWAGSWFQYTTVEGKNISHTETKLFIFIGYLKMGARRGFERTHYGSATGKFNIHIISCLGRTGFGAKLVTANLPLWVWYHFWTHPRRRNISKHNIFSSLDMTNALKAPWKLIFAWRKSIRR